MVPIFPALFYDTRIRVMQKCDWIWSNSEVYDILGIYQSIVLNFFTWTRIIYNKNLGPKSESSFSKYNVEVLNDKETFWQCNWWCFDFHCYMSSVIIYAMTYQFLLKLCNSWCNYCRCLMDKNFVRIGKWFVRPYEKDEKPVNKRWVFLIFICLCCF